MSETNSDTRRSDDPAAARAALRALRERIVEATTEVVWRQWSAVGAMASVSTHATALVDPEALVMMSLTLAPSEPRLGDLVADWTIRNSDLLSVQRMRNLADRYPAMTQARLRGLARIAVSDGKDHRWKSVLDDGNPVEEVLRRRNKMRAVRTPAVVPAALVLRLRLAFGVGIKADLLAFLLSTRVDARAVEISRATSYTADAVRKAAKDLAQARFIDAAAAVSTEYHVSRSAWRVLLGIRQLPRWRAWNERFMFVSDFLLWADNASERALTAYVLDSTGRDVLETHPNAYPWQRLWQQQSPDTAADGSGLFAVAVNAFADWMLRVA